MKFVSAIGNKISAHRASAKTDGDHFKRNALVNILFYPASMLYFELVLRIHCGIEFFSKNLAYIALFSVAAGGIVGIIALVGGRKWNRIAGAVIVSVATVLFGTQAVYFTIFNEYVTFYSFTNVGMVLAGFWKDALIGIWHTLPTLLFLFVPFAAYFIFGKKVVLSGKLGFRWVICVLAASVLCHSMAVTFVTTSTAGIMSDRYVYREIFNTKLSVPRFGILTTARLDLRNVILTSMKKENITVPSNETKPDTTPTPEPPQETEESPEITPSPSPSPEPEEDTVVVYEPNVLEIDFDKLISEESNGTVADMHRYFSGVEPTLKNQYTGMFEGYDLIWIVAESFSTFALDETHTPTLCRLANEGFVFNNFYNPVWGVSTSDGEYVATTGLIPKTGVWSYYWSGFNYMPFGFGNMFSKLGYSARAYHNNEYTYYDRHISYPNMGYDYKGVGNGLDVAVTWPESDIEMMEKTVGEYVNDKNFMVYYLTVSGHLNYNFYGNAMCVKHQSEVDDLPYSEEARAYIACQMEFDQAVKLLIDELDKAGRLDKTVIVISGDHYPYGMEVSSMEEIYGGELDTAFEMYKSTLIIWNVNAERTEVDKYCSSLDIMPTLANLFGLDYDSRLVFGRDILSDSDGLVVFYDHSFITDEGRYNASTDEYIPANEAVGDNENAIETLEAVNDMFEYSEKILDFDYYAKVLGDTEDEQ